MSQDAAFDELEQSFFAGDGGAGAFWDEGTGARASVYPVMLEEIEEDEREVARASIRAERRARFVRPVAVGVAGLGVLSLLVFASAWLRRAPGEEEPQRSGPSEGVSTVGRPATGG